MKPTTCYANHVRRLAGFTIQNFKLLTIEHKDSACEGDAIVIAERMREGLPDTKVARSRGARRVWIQWFRGKCRWFGVPTIVSRGVSSDTPSVPAL